MTSYKNPALSTEERVQDLLAQMTLDEKVGQLIQLFGWRTFTKNEDGTVTLTEEFKEDIRQGKIGSLYATLRADPWTEVTLETGLSPAEGAAALNDIQRFVIEHSRLGIPLMFGEECSHGHMAIGATVYPVPLLAASTWNPALYQQMCEAVAIETRSQGGVATYSPVLDIVRDPRWGRTEETYGEDPYLAGELAAAAVIGLQGKGLDSPDTVIATLKHFVGYGASEGGRNAAPVHMGMKELHEIDLVPFRKAIEAGAISVMTAYNEIDGVPCTSSEYLLDDVLRQQWGFDGFIITDASAMNMLVHGYNVAETGEKATALSLQAGIDLEMSGYMFGKYLKSALEQGIAQEAHLDQAVSRLLKVKFQLGLFDQPYVDPERAARVIHSPEHIELAREVARQGIILLKNEASALPLQPSSTGKIAVIGPNANKPYNQLGDYTSPQPAGKVITLLEGLRQKLGADSDQLLYAPGCRIKDDSREGFDLALDTAKQADTVILVLGGSSARDFGEGTIDLRTGQSLVHDSEESDMECGEGIDRSNLNLTGVQLELCQQIYELGKKLIVIYINGRPVAEPWIDEHADAIIEAWYPGQEGGHALAEILYGDVNPSGRLTISVPRHVGQLPVYYNSKRTRGKRYLEMDLQPAYAFGHGLSYTTFAYDAPVVTPAVIAPDEHAQVSVQITNTGEVAGWEVAQLYLTDLFASVTRPEKELKGFQKVFLQPGETTTVTFTLTPEHLELVTSQLDRIVEPGDFHIQVGSNSVEGQVVTLTVR
ncbi:beta-glucosidase [Paenibacillus sp. SORGH_AS306]|uniref:glycoside hydrolase family 3 N-terminal domain-containing protein n=1 Tax=unclassified Paenibacillus TaxID=185978 RepID=UPI0027896AD5|nr:MULTISPECIES: glycoside hydrolase family 3 N-terminal domain-containing protein [unclassified Paenibacillus]MDQ1232913.1 beta-glucosidase [Paenibacillus sp. SORGH_AS_0306]MDR6109960.1 beta-glucosidase [Paenibacillus sp. SORGH_AS_0338]